MITVVSGLPRSGTSLAMQMLAAGGMPVLIDGERQADADNPRGYYEWERIKRLPYEPSCIAEAEGKAVKVISHLLLALPHGHDYSVVFMQRPLAEVAASQAEMIRRRGTTGAALEKAALLSALQAHLNQINFWLGKQPHIRTYRLDYQAVIEQPLKAATMIQQFLPVLLDPDAMARQVDASLYRQRDFA